MAQYKVPQDVEAEDKLIGPFTFRQFIYLLIAAGGVAGAWGLFQVFPLLGIIPLPLILFFIILALPIKKDQPMETYLSAIISFHLKPRKRFWIPGQRESTILITAPKQTEKSRVRNITENEASQRLSFLANLIDTEGHAIRGENTLMKEEYAAEADEIQDILEADNPVIDRIINTEQQNRHQELISQMRTAINRNENLIAESPQAPITQQSNQVARQMLNLANSSDFSIQTIANQANRLQQSSQTSVDQALPSLPVQPYTPFSNQSSNFQSSPNLQNANEIFIDQPKPIFSPKEQGEK